MAEPSEHMEKMKAWIDSCEVARIEAFCVDPGPARDALAKTLTQAKVKITLHTADGEQMVKLYQPDPSSGEAIAETTADAPLYRVNPIFIKDFTKELFDLQDKRLLGVEYTDIAMLTVKTRTEQFGLINQNGEWVLEDRPTEKLNQPAVDLFVSRVANSLGQGPTIWLSILVSAPLGFVAPFVHKDWTLVLLAAAQFVFWATVVVYNIKNKGNKRRRVVKAAVAKSGVGIPEVKAALALLKACGSDGAVKEALAAAREIKAMV